MFIESSNGHNELLKILINDSKADVNKADMVKLIDELYHVIKT